MADDPESFVLKGFAPQLGSDGLYVKAPPLVNGRGAYRLQSLEDWWCCYVEATDEWQIQTTELKGQDESAAYNDGVDPWDPSGEWQEFRTGEFQPVQISVPIVDAYDVSDKTGSPEKAVEKAAALFAALQGVDAEDEEDEDEDEDEEDDFSGGLDDDEDDFEGIEDEFDHYFDEEDEEWEDGSSDAEWEMVEEDYMVVLNRQRVQAKQSFEQARVTPLPDSDDDYDEYR